MPSATLYVDLSAYSSCGRRSLLQRERLGAGGCCGDGVSTTNGALFRSAAAASARGPSCGTMRSTSFCRMGIFDAQGFFCVAVPAEVGKPNDGLRIRLGRTPGYGLDLVGVGAEERCRTLGA